MKKSLRVFVVLSIAASSLIFSTSANAAVNDLTSISASDAVALLTEGNMDISVVAGSEVAYGSMKSFSSISLNGSPGFEMFDSGILLNSHSGSPYGADNSNNVAPLAIRTKLNSILDSAGLFYARTTNVSALSFNFTTAKPSIELDFLFASKEFQFSNWDIAAVIVDGVNYAFLPNGSILRVRPESNLCNFNSTSYGDNVTNPACSDVIQRPFPGYGLSGTFNTLENINAAAPTARIVGLLNPDPTLTQHNITFAVADTTDQIVPSFLMFSLVRGSIQTFGGIFVYVEPDAPTSVVATATSSTTANISFTAPVSDGGTQITSYTATSSPGGITGTIEQEGSGTIPMTGLTPGTTYTFTVKATNSAGDSLPSIASNSITLLGAPTAPTSVVATATGKRSATVSFAAPSLNGGSAVTSYTATSTPGGITKTLTQANGGTFTFDGLQPGTSYKFAVTATNAIGTSAATTSNSVTTTPLVVASLSALSFVDDGTGTGGKIVWTGKNIDAVLYTGSAAYYPGPYNYGAFTSGWNGRIRNLTADTSYTVSIYAISADGVGESKSLTFKTSATLPALAGAKSATISQADQMAAQLPKLFTWINENVFVDGEGDRMKTALNKFDAVKVPTSSAYLKLPNPTVLTVSATSSTPAVCKVEAQVTVHSIAAGTCTISYTVSGASRAPATLVKDFVFKKFAK